jgi:hypothetical protein
MHIAIQKIVQFKSNIKLEYVYNVLIVTIVAIILIKIHFVDCLIM